MTALHEGLCAFWNGFSIGGLPVHAYLSGQVPEDATFPYITFEIEIGRFATFNFLTATVWAKGKNRNAVRAEILDAIAQAIPEGGATVVTRDGMLLLNRSGASFLSMTNDPQDASVCGGRVSYQVNYYGV